MDKNVAFPQNTQAWVGLFVCLLVFLNLSVFGGNNVNQEKQSQDWWAKDVFLMQSAHRRKFSPPKCDSLENSPKSH